MRIEYRIRRFYGENHEDAKEGSQRLEAVKPNFPYLILLFGPIGLDYSLVRHVDIELFPVRFYIFFSFLPSFPTTAVLTEVIIMMMMIMMPKATMFM